MKHYRPTTPSRRHMTTVSYRGVITTRERYKPLTQRLKAHAGRNHRGSITVRHQGSGNKKIYRTVDFMQDRMDIPAKVLTIEYDPYRSGFIALILYRDGRRAYVLAPHTMKPGDALITSNKAPLLVGNRMPLQEIPVGTFVHNVEMRRGSGGIIARSAGSYAEVLAHENEKTDLKLGSKEIRKVSSKGFATIGQVSNIDYNLVNIGKAGRSRWFGIRPTVRGSAMNPVDHPYGGGEGAQPRGTKRPKTMWGKVTGGHKTRHKKKWSTRFIVERRPKVR